MSADHGSVPDLNDLLYISLAVVITVLNAYSGFALVAEGFMLDNPLLTTVGSLIGVSGSILSYIMVRESSCFHSALVVLTSLQCVAMNRSLTNVLFGGIGTIVPSEATKIEGTVTKTTVDDTVEALANADSVILVSPFPPFVISVSLALFRLLDMAWLWLKLNMLSRKSVRCSVQKVSMCALPFTRWRVACLVNAMCFWRRHRYHMTVRWILAPTKLA